MNISQNGVLNCILRILLHIFRWNFVFALSYRTGYFKLKLLAPLHWKPIWHDIVLFVLSSCNVIDHFRIHFILLECYFNFFSSLCWCIAGVKFITDNIFVRKKVNVRIYVVHMSLRNLLRKLPYLRSFLHKYERINENLRLCKKRNINVNLV